MRLPPLRSVLLTLSATLLSCTSLCGQSASVSAQKSYFGFDRNDYPGDDSLPVFRNSFAFVGYWLGPPPGEKQSTWLGKRRLLESQGFGFVLLLNGKATREIKTPQDAQRNATAQAQQAAKLADQEGFSRGTVIFLDIEEGGRLPPPYQQYLQNWADELVRAGYRPGVYCSGIPVDEPGGVRITTAEDIRAHIGSRQITYWVFNDACPPSPGGILPAAAPQPANSGISFAAIWQYLRSPRQKEISARCPEYAPDGNYYAPGDSGHKWFLDLSVATSPNPSAPKN